MAKTFHDNDADLALITSEAKIYEQEVKPDLTSGNSVMCARGFKMVNGKQPVAAAA